MKKINFKKSFQNFKKGFQPDWNLLPGILFIMGLALTGMIFDHFFADHPYYPDIIKTITYENGKEFAGHMDIAKESQSKSYFAHPYSSWERGLNENTNGLIRQYFPKGSDFSLLSKRDIEIVIHKLNNRPRKCLEFKTPNQAIFGINPPIALVS